MDLPPALKPRRLGHHRWSGRLHLVWVLWKPLAGLVLGLISLFGCSSREPDAHAATATPAVLAQDRLQAAPLQGPALEEIVRAAGPCHFDPALWVSPVASSPQHLRLTLRRGHRYHVRLAGSAGTCVLSGDTVEVRYHQERDGHLRMTCLTLEGSPAVVRDGQGAPLLVGPSIILHLDQQGLSGVELPGDSGAMLAVPSSLIAPTSGA